MPTAKDIHRHQYEANKLHKRLIREATRAAMDFAMIEEGDHIMVCLSGGKDSYAMLDLLLTIRARVRFDFKITAVNLDQKQPGFPADVLPNYLQQLEVPYKIVEEDTYSIVKRLIPEGQTTCSLCSRLRRGVLYRVADEIGASKLALGHHRDDILETFFLNIFFNAQLKAMPPKLRSDDGKHVVIRPLAYIAEKDLVRYAAIKAFPIIPCNLCGSQPNLQRVAVKEMLHNWEKQFPGRSQTIFNALTKVTPSHLLDRQQYDFQKLLSTRANTTTLVNAFTAEIGNGDSESSSESGSEDGGVGYQPIQWMEYKTPA